MTVSARAILELGPLNHKHGKRYSHQRVQRMPSNGQEFSDWLYRSHMEDRELAS